MIALHGVSKRFRARTAEVVAADDVSMVARDGHITALLGPNGAGKTTCLRMLAGLMSPDAGHIEVDGMAVTAAPDAVRARLGVLTETRGLSPRLTAGEQIRHIGRLHGLGDAATDARMQALAQRLDMQMLLARRCEGFSQGERMKTALAAALIHAPHNVVLDEPTNGLDIPSTRALRGLLRELAAQGRCVLMCTHVMSEVEHLADSVIVLAAGRVRACGSVAELKALTGRDTLEDAVVELAYSGAYSGTDAGPDGAAGGAR